MKVDLRNYEVQRFAVVASLKVRKCESETESVKVDLGNDDVVQRLAVVSRCGRHRGRISPGSAQTKVSRRYLKNLNLTESVQDTTQPICIGIFKRENSILIRIVTNLGVADGAVASLSSYAGSVILVCEVESARVVVRLDESCRP